MKMTIMTKNQFIEINEQRQLILARNIMMTEDIAMTKNTIQEVLYKSNFLVQQTHFVLFYRI